MKHVFYILILFCACQPASAQSYDHIWLTGYDEFPALPGYGYAQIRFQGDSVLVTPAQLAFNFESTLAALSDESGNLLFYSNGCAVANREHEIMPNGAGLNHGAIGELDCPWKGYIVPQGAMALPAPADPGRFYYCKP